MKNSITCKECNKIFHGIKDKENTCPKCLREMMRAICNNCGTIQKTETTECFHCKSRDNFGYVD